MQAKIRRESRGGRPAALKDGVLWTRRRQVKDDDEGRGGGAPADGRRLLGDVEAMVMVI
jgi:hypothetical protein